MHPMRRRAAVVAFAVALQLAVSLLTLAHGGERTPDTPTYERAIPQLLSHATFDRQPGWPETVRTPGYPLLLAALTALFGGGSLSVLLAQVVMRGALVSVAFSIAKEAFGDRAGTIAALLVALDPASLFAAATIETETFFTLMLLLGLQFCVRASAPSAPLRVAAGAAMLIAAAVFIRPIGYYLVPLLALWLFARHRRAAVVYLLVAVVLLGGWQWRNKVRAGTWNFTTITAMSLYFYRAAGVTALQQHRSVADVQRDLGFTPHSDEADLPTLQRWTREGKAILRSAPLLMIRTQVEGAVRTLFGPGRETAQVALGDRFARAAVAIALLHLAALYGGLLLTAILRRKELRWESLLPYAIAAVYLVAISAGPEAYSRFRVPAVPLFAIFAAPGLAALLRGGRAAAALETTD